MPTQENPHAGKGAVVLDIGGDIGALIVEMPPHMVDLEVEIIPTGTDARPQVAVSASGSQEPAAAGSHEHDHPHVHDDHPHDYGPDHTHGHGAGEMHTHDAAAPPHVAVVARPTPEGSVIYSLVYELAEGTYDLYVRPYGPVRLTATVVGGEITQSRWPE